MLLCQISVVLNHRPWMWCAVRRTAASPCARTKRRSDAQRIGHVERNLLTEAYNRFIVCGGKKERKKKKRLSMTETESFLRRMISL